MSAYPEERYYDEGQAQASARDRGNVEQQADRIGRTVEHLDKLLAVLRERLGPVLVQRPISGAVPNDTVPTAPRSDLAARLAGLADGLERVADGFSSMHDSVDL